MSARPNRIAKRHGSQSQAATSVMAAARVRNDPLSTVRCAPVLDLAERLAASRHLVRLAKSFGKMSTCLGRHGKLQSSWKLGFKCWADSQGLNKQDIGLVGLTAYDGHDRYHRVPPVISKKMRHQNVNHSILQFQYDSSQEPFSNLAQLLGRPPSCWNGCSLFSFDRFLLTHTQGGISSWDYSKVALSWQ